MKNKSKDRDSNFLVMFSSSKAERAIEKREGMAHWCWPQFVMTHEMCSTCSTQPPKLKKNNLQEMTFFENIIKYHDCWWPGTLLINTNGYIYMQAVLINKKNQLISPDQCLKLMVAQSPLVNPNWVGPVKFDHGQVKIVIDHIRREFFWIFLSAKWKS